MKNYTTCTNWHCPIYKRVTDKEMTRRCTGDLCRDYEHAYNKYDYSCSGLILIIKTEEHGGKWYNGIDMERLGGNYFGHVCSSYPTAYSRTFDTEDKAIKDMLNTALCDAEHNIREQWAVDYIKNKIAERRQLSLF